MKKIIDNFSNQASIYKKFRPTYPKALYDIILAQVNHLGICWDCGTGNGQAASFLSHYFEEVWATDISERQISNAIQKDNIQYSVQRAEQTQFPDQSIDLITVGQAMHWFDFDAFHQEANRVLKQGGIMAIWGYGLLRIQSDIDLIIDEFYEDIIGPYWNEERKHIDAHYETIPFPYTSIPVSQSFYIEAEWDLKHLEGYLGSWSSVQRYMKQTGLPNPVAESIERIRTHWKEGQQQTVRFPLFLQLGIKQ